MYDNNDKVTKSVADAARKIMEGVQPEVLSEELKGKQHKIDKNKNGKIDAHDFKLLRKEDVEQVDELSKTTLGNYVKKASKDGSMSAYWAGRDSSKKSKVSKASVKKNDNIAAKRIDGIEKATSRLTKEDFEQMEEGKMGQLSADLTDLSHSDFHKQYGKPKSHYDSSNFKKPVQKGKEMDRAKSLAQRGMASMKKEEIGIEEETEHLKEYESVNGVYRHKGTYGSAKGAEYGATDWDAEEKLKDEPKKPARKKYGARQNFVRSKRVNEGFTDLLNTYTEGGIKSLLESLEYNKMVLEEESTNDEFTAEIKKAQDKSQGKDKAKVSEPKVDAVEDVSEEVEKHAFVAVHAKKGMHQTKGSTSYEAAKNVAAHWKMKSTAGIDVHRADKTHVAEELDQIEERELSSSEQDKKETYVKGMKKGLQGFKDRYGDRAKEVMYATSTKMAKKD